jgi:hypothetical protein
VWGDNPEDYRKVQRNEHGMLEPDLPTSESVTDDWVVDVEWLSMNAYVVDCIITGIRFTGSGFFECPQHIQDKAFKVVELLWKRYKENVGT